VRDGALRVDQFEMNAPEPAPVAHGGVERVLHSVLLRRLRLRLGPHVPQIPGAADDAERRASELDRHEMIDGVVSPERVRDAVGAEHRRAVA